MSPKVVDKNKKRLEILNNSYSFLIQEGIKKFSIDALLKYLNMSKGTFYHYFKSKDELIQSMMSEFTKSYIIYCDSKLKKSKNLKEKLEILFEIYLKSSKENSDFLKLYNEFLLTYSVKERKKLYDIDNSYIVYLSSTLKDAINIEIEKGLVKNDAVNLVSSLSATVDGMLLYSFMIKDYELNKEVQNYIDNFILMIKKD